MLCRYCRRPLEPLKNFCPHCMGRQATASTKRNCCFLRLFWKNYTILLVVTFSMTSVVINLARHNSQNTPAADFTESITDSPTKTVGSIISETIAMDLSCTAVDSTTETTLTFSEFTTSTRKASPSISTESTTSMQTSSFSKTQPTRPQVPMEAIRRRVEEKLDFDIRPVSENTILAEAGIWYDPYEDIEIIVNQIAECLRISYVNSIFNMPMVYYLRSGGNIGNPNIYVGTGYVCTPLKTENFDSQECIRAVIANIQPAYPERKFKEVLGSYVPSFTHMSFSCSTAMSQEEVVAAYTQYLLNTSSSHEELYIAYLGTQNVVNGISGITEERHIFTSPIYND